MINPSFPVLYQPSENSSFSHAQDDIAFGEVDKTLVFEPFQLEIEDPDIEHPISRSGQ